MDEVITLDLGYFLRYMTAYLDGVQTTGFTSLRGIEYVPGIVNGQYFLFERDKLDKLLRVINSTFFKCYGGWRMDLHFDDFGIFTGEASFTPADLHGSPAQKA